jgi:hypothetical protein
MISLIKLIERYRINSALRKARARKKEMELANRYEFFILDQDPKYKDLIDRIDKLERQRSRTIY